MKTQQGKMTAILKSRSERDTFSEPNKIEFFNQTGELPIEYLREYDGAAEHFAKQGKLPDLMGTPKHSINALMTSNTRLQWRKPTPNKAKPSAITNQNKRTEPRTTSKNTLASAVHERITNASRNLPTQGKTSKAAIRRQVDTGRFNYRRRLGLPLYRIRCSFPSRY